MSKIKPAVKSLSKAAKKAKRKETAKKIIKTVAKGMAGSSVSKGEMKKAMPKGDAYKKLMSKGADTGTKAAALGAMAGRKSMAPPGVKVGKVKPKPKAKVAQSIIDMVRVQDPNSGVTESEYKAAMKKGSDRKKKNTEESRKSNY